MLIAVRSAFGLPACFHLANIILGWIDNHDDRLMLTETMQRLGGTELREIAERWQRELSQLGLDQDAKPEADQGFIVDPKPQAPSSVEANPRSAWRLELKSADLIDALRAMSAAQKTGRQLRLSFDGQNLEILRGATRVGIPAVGVWPLVALVSTRLIRELVGRRAALPEKILVSCTEFHLHFSHYSIPCSWS